MITDHMKSLSNFGIYFASIVGATVLAAIVIGARHQWPEPAPAQRSDQPIHSAPPPGYAIQTNGQGQWRWFRTQNGDRDSWAPMDSRQDAVESAWIWYNYDHAEKQTWRLETSPPDPNAGLLPSTRTADHASDYRP